MNFKNLNTIIATIFLFSFLSGCAHKIPSNKGADLGVLAIPLKIESEGTRNFAYYYTIDSQEPNVANIAIYPSIGKMFEFSKPLPPGDYKFEYIDMIGNSNINLLRDSIKKTKRIHIPITIKAGEVTMMKRVLSISTIETSSRRYITTHKFTSFDDDELDVYRKKLEEMNKSNEWKIN